MEFEVHFFGSSPGLRYGPSARPLDFSTVVADPPNHPPAPRSINDLQGDRMIVGAFAPLRL
jgi:hypothetical protein